MARVILYTGKGGVGKTTMAAAAALRCSQRGARTIVLSTDAAHSLGDSFDVALSPEPAQVADRLWAQESDVYYNVQRYWGTVQRWLQSVFAWEGVGAVMAEEMAILPGMDELASLLWILEHQRAGAYDVIVVDCAPTAETLRLLSFPETGHWWLDKLFPVGRRATGFARPLLRRLTDLPVPDDEVFAATEQLFRQLDRIQAVLSDPETTTARLVVNPEKMVIKEAQRTYTYLGLYGYLTDLVVCNRMLPDSADETYFSAWREQQREYLQLATESFSPTPVRVVPFFEREVVGIPMLERVADALFGEDDPAAVLYAHRPFRIERLDGGAVEMALPVPLAERGELSLVEAGDELVIQVGRYRHNMVLPRMLVGRGVRSARLEQGSLLVRFGGEPGDDSNGTTPGTRGPDTRSGARGR